MFKAIEQFEKAILSTSSPSVKSTLSQLFSLFALDRVYADGVFFLQNGVLNAQQSANISREIQRLCTVLGKDALDLTAAFGIPDHMHHAPIANNWVEYNAVQNDGELNSQKYRHHPEELRQKFTSKL